MSYKEVLKFTYENLEGTNNYALIKVVHMDKECFPENERDNELKVTFSPDLPHGLFAGELIIGTNSKRNCFVVEKEDIPLIQTKVNAINKKYGIIKQKKEKHCYYISIDNKVVLADALSKEERKKLYDEGNYFEDKNHAEDVAKTFMQCRKESFEYLKNYRAMMEKKEKVKELPEEVIEFAKAILGITI